jgi:hypothetical protein
VQPVASSVVAASAMNIWEIRMKQLLALLA